MSAPLHIFWFRRDLRLHDNAGLHHALQHGVVQPVFIFDRDILDHLEEKDDKRVSFIYDALQQMQKTLESRGATLDVRYGRPLDIFRVLIADYEVAAVYTNHDYEPYAVQRDKEIGEVLAAHGIGFHTYKDQVIFEKDEVVKDDGKPYAVYTPFSRKWKSLFHEGLTRPYAISLQKFYQQKAKTFPSLEEMGFIPAEHPGPAAVQQEIIRHYHETRDLPSLRGTTRLGVHLRFGTVSVREVATIAAQLNDTFLGELIWREFFMQMLWHHPQLEHRCFRSEYEGIQWRNNEQDFRRWCEGKTGYPIVDAGMRELNATGFMHNRVRMIAASFLVKHLLVDWKWGEAYFARKLLDFDLAANNGNWQWVAGCGCDAAPYFRIFNPDTQTKRFDAKLEYIRKWVPELNSFEYPQPMVDHKTARERCLQVYKQALADAGK